MVELLQHLVHNQIQCLAEQIVRDEGDVVVKSNQPLLHHRRNVIPDQSSRRILLDRQDTLHEEAE